MNTLGTRPCPVCARQAGTSPACQSWPCTSSGRHWASRPCARWAAAQASGRKAAVVVGVGLFGAVFIRVARAVQQAGRIDHVGLHPTAVCRWQARRQQAQGLAPGRFKRADHSGGPETCEDGREAGQQRAHIASVRAQRLRQGASDVRQAAGLEQRVVLGADLKDAHGFGVGHGFRGGGDQVVNRFSMSLVTKTTPCGLRSKRAASSSGSSPMTKSFGQCAAAVDDHLGQPAAARPRSPRAASTAWSIWQKECTRTLEKSTELLTMSPRRCSRPKPWC